MLVLIRTFILSNFIWVLLASSAVSAFAGGWIVLKVNQASLASELKQEAAERQKEQARANQIAHNLEIDLAKERAKRANAERELRDELKNPDYTNCHVPANGVRILQSIVGASAS